VSKNYDTIANISLFISSTNVFVEEGLIASHLLSSVCKLHAGQVKHSMPFHKIAGEEQRELHMYSIRRALLLSELGHYSSLARPTSMHSLAP
jgi:hypothetical protein